jgi:hypothetical protein
MRLVISAVSASMAAAAAAAGLDKLLSGRPDWVWWSSTAAIFVVAFGVAWAASGHAKPNTISSIASRLWSWGKMKVKLGTVSSETSSEIASRNRSRGNMEIDIDRVTLKKK